MEAEVKKVTAAWDEKNTSYVNNLYLYEMLLQIDEDITACETALSEAGMGIGYRSRKAEAESMIADRVMLWPYIMQLRSYVETKLDQPLYKSFVNGATETISRIKIEDISIENERLPLTEDYYINGGMYGGSTSVNQVKPTLKFSDFFGNKIGEAEGNGLYMSYSDGCVEEFAEIFASQYEGMKQAGMFGSEGDITLEDYLNSLEHQGEFDHGMDKPFLSFVSAVLDITIVKPVIEALTGEDMITKEDLSDLERGMKAVFAVIDVVTLGSAVGATKLGEYSTSQLLKYAGKTLCVEFASNTAACGIGAIGEELGLPAPVILILSLAGGITVSKLGTRYIFRNAEGTVLRVIDKSLCSEEDLYRYLSKNVGSDAAEDFLKNGTWPKGIQVPKNPSVLNADGSINWSAAAKGGYTLDANGNAIKTALTDTEKVELYLPEGKVLDRYGDSGGRYVSPINNGVPYSYEQRSLPYIEDASNYHQYEVTGDFSKLEEYIKNCSDIDLKNEILDDIDYYYNGDFSKVVVNVGEIAKVDGWGIGGGIQYEFPIKVEYLEKLGLLKEIK